MRYLYLDNFRGFSDTEIPIKNVNFLVGENSTGKTSILSLIHILGDYRFPFDTEFNVDDCQLGNFRDLVSAESRKRTSFFIGYYNGDGSVEDTHFFLIRFINHQGLPRPESYTDYSNGMLTYLKAKDNNFQHRHAIISKGTDLLKLFRETTKKRLSAKQKLKEFVPERKFPRSRLLVYGPQIFNEILQKEGGGLLRGGGHPISAILEPTVWIAPIRAKPRRTYDEQTKNFSSEGHHTPYVLKKQLGSLSQANDFKSAIESVGKEGGLFQSVRIKQFGRDKSSSPFQIEIILNKTPLGINNVGYGVPQSLPIIVELLLKRRRTYIIQQPEVHLHPKAQAAMGELFYHAVTSQERNRLLIETHSDFLIDRFRRCLRKGEKTEAQVLFFHRTSTGNAVFPIEIKPDGDYSEKQPPEFRDFFIKEEMANLGLSE